MVTRRKKRKRKSHDLYVYGENDDFKHSAPSDEDYKKLSRHYTHQQTGDSCREASTAFEE